MSNLPKKRFNRRAKNSFSKKENLYFSNEIDTDIFSKNIIKDLAFFQNIIELRQKDEKATIEIEELEHKAFNLLIRSIELEKENSKVEVGVIGSFSSGKSTFINSLFKKPVCPMSVKPTTSSITKFYYGHKEKISINGKEINQKEYQNLSQHLEKDTQNTKSNYIEYAYPFESFNSIVLYDTPGFNNNLNENDTEITMKTLQSVDVIFFIIDISKGSIDKTSIERLETLKEKQMYCILNKSDTKSEKAIEKIKQEIISKKIFLEVIEYSAIKVLEEGEIDYFTNFIKQIETKLIPEKIDFTTQIKGTSKEIKGRRITKQTYELSIDNNSYTVDEFYIKAKNQRDRIEKMLNNLAENKQYFLKQNLKIDKYNYTQEASATIEKLLQTLSNESPNQEFQNFEKDIEKLKSDCNAFEKKHLEHLHKEWNHAFVDSCSIEVFIKDTLFGTKNTFKISFAKSKFKLKISSIQFISFMKNFMEKQIKNFQLKYNFTLFSLYFQEDMYKEALYWYSNLHNSNFILNETNIYFEDKNEARNKLNSFYNLECKTSIRPIDDFLDINKKHIDDFRLELHSKDKQKEINKKEIKEKLTKFLKEKKNAQRL